MGMKTKAAFSVLALAGEQEEVAPRKGISGQDGVVVQ